MKETQIQKDLLHHCSVTGMAFCGLDGCFVDMVKVDLPKDKMLEGQPDSVVNDASRIILT